MNWNPRSKPPKNIDAFGPWFVRDLELFRRSRADLPQGVVGARARNKIIRAWNQAREAAELEDAAKQSPEFYAMVERFQRTRTIVFTPKARKSAKASRKKSPRD